MSEKSTANPVGRPLKFDDIEALELAIDSYFKECDNRQVDYVTKDGSVVKITRRAPYTVSGLAYHLNTSRETLLDYGNGSRDDENSDFSGTIKKAKDRCLAWVEQQLFEGTGAPAGVIFNLKNNYGWVDKTEVDANLDHTSKGDKIESVSADIIGQVIAGVKDKTANAAG